MPDTVHVICLNDFPAAVFIGSEVGAEEERDHLASELEEQDRRGFHAARYWHIHAVPLVRGHVEPASPYSAGILLDMWSEQLQGVNPKVERIAGKLHQLADSLLSKDEPAPC